MSTTLLLLAEGLAAPSAEWPCGLWSLSQPIQHMPLEQAAHMLNGQTAEVLLPMELCSWLCTEPWPSRRHPGAQAIAYALEDQLGEALDALHLSVGARQPQGGYPVMVIGRERFAAVLGLLADVGIEVGAVRVDADVLAGDQPLAVRWGGRWLLGAGMPARLVLSDAAFALLESMLPSETRCLDERQEALQVDALLTAPAAGAIDLRNGAFARRRKRLPWRVGVTSIVLLLGMTWGANESRRFYIERETRVLADASEQRFKTLYPDQARVGSLSTQLQRLQDERPASQPTQLMDLLDVMERVVGASNVQVQRVEFRAREGWRIKLRANSFSELEQLRERGREQGVPVRLDSASRQNNRVEATLALEEGL